MEELKARILEIVEDYEEGISVLDNDMAQAGIDPKSDFINTIEQLLEERECKAREEGYQKGWEECEEFYGDMREILRPYHIEAEDYRTTLKRLLKLKTKEEEKEIYKCVKCGRVVEDKRLLTFSGVCTRCTVVI